MRAAWLLAPLLVGHSAGVEPCSAPTGRGPSGLVARSPLPGSYCPSDDSVPVVCPSGHHCPPGRRTPVRCQYSMPPSLNLQRLGHLHSRRALSRRCLGPTARHGATHPPAATSRPPSARRVRSPRHLSTCVPRRSDTALRRFV